MFEDINALIYCEGKLERCKAEHEMMKAVNEYYRTHGTIIGCPAVSEEKAAELDEDMRRRYPMHNQPYMPYALKNNAAEIRRLKVQLGITSEKHDEKRIDEKIIEASDISAKEDIFLRVDAFKDEPWYDDVALFTRIGVCKTKAENAPEVCKALNQLGYSVRLKTKDGELYVLPQQEKKAKEPDAR